MNTQLTTTDLESGTAIVIVPVGSFEQHGPHLPLDTDTRIALAVIDATLRQLSHLRVVVAPPFGVSASDEHNGFTGTLSLGTEAFASSAIALARSAHWARGVVFVNGHGGNADAFTAVTNALSHDGISHAIWSPPYVDGDDSHAGKTETSLLLHIDPEVVRADTLPAGNTQDLHEIMPVMRDHGVIGVSKNGVLGDASLATETHGKEIFSRYCTSLSQLLKTVDTKWTSL